MSRLLPLAIHSKLRFVLLEDRFPFPMLDLLCDIAVHFFYAKRVMPLTILFTQVQRTHQDFLDLDEFLRTSTDFSRMPGFPQHLPQLPDDDTAPLSSFLQQIILEMGDFLWNCPRMLCFLDDTHGKQSLRDAQVGVLNQKVIPVTSNPPPVFGNIWQSPFSRLCQKRKPTALILILFLVKLDPGSEHCVQDTRDQTVRRSGHVREH